MSVSRLIFGVCLISLAGIFLALSFLVNSGERFGAIFMLALSLCVWGSLTYFVRSKLACYRPFWLFCAVISFGWFFGIFGSTVYYDNDSTDIFESSQELPKEKYLYHNPQLIFKFYHDIYLTCTDPKNTERDRPVYLFVLLLSIFLPLAFILSCYHCWRPHKQNENC